MRARTAIRAAAWGTVALGVAAPLVRRRAQAPAPGGDRRQPPPRRSRCAWPCRARARATSRRAAADVRLRRDLPDAPRRPGGARGARAGRLPGDGRPRCSGSASCPACGCSGRWPATGRVRARDQVLVWTHWIWFLVPHGTVAYVLLRHRDRFPRAAALVYATFDLGVIGYWARARPRRRGTPRRQGASRARSRRLALRRMMVEHGEAFWKEPLGAPLQCAGRQPARRHALAALRHVRRWPRTSSPTSVRVAGRDRLDLRADARLRARVPRRALRHRSARRRWRSPRASGAAAPRAAPAGAGRSRAVQALERTGARMTRGAGGARRREPEESSRRRRGDAAGRHHARERALIFGLFVVSAIAFLYFVLPQLAGLGDTWHRARARATRWLADRARRFECLSFARLRRRCSARCSCAAGTRIDCRESYQITMAGLAATRLFAAGGAGGIALTAWALRRAGMARARGRRPDARVPRAALRGLHAARSSSAASGSTSGSSRRRRRSRSRSCPAIFGLVAFVIALRDGARCPADLERRLASAGRRPRPRPAPAGAAPLATVPASISAGRPHGDRPHRARGRLGRARRGRLVGLRHRRRCGRASTPSAHDRRRSR